MNENHLRSQNQASHAELLMRSGNTADAYNLYAVAAAEEEKALHAIDPTRRPRTWGILAVSVVSLFYKGTHYAEAERRALQFLNRNEIPDFARVQLKELLAVVWEGQDFRSAGIQYAGEGITISLRGREIGAGTAPIDLVLDKITGVNSLIFRVAEWLGRHPLRRHGPPPPEIREICQPWMTQPQVGSYRFGVRLVQSLQGELIPRQSFGTTEIADSLLSIVRAVAPQLPGTSGQEDIVSIVPDRDYRNTMLKLVRNMVPDGQRLKEVEFATVRANVSTRVVLFENARLSITETLRASLPTDAFADVITGTLRAVHLDKKWIEVLTDAGISQRCEITADVLDDVIGPMVNRRVIVRGKWSTSKHKIRVSDIELGTSAKGK